MLDNAAYAILIEVIAFNEINSEHYTKSVAKRESTLTDKIKLFQ